MVVTWDAVVFAIAHFGGIAFPLALEFYVRNFVEKKIGYAGIGHVWIFKLDAEADLLVVAAGEREGGAPPIGEVEAAWAFLNVAPVGANIDFLRERKLY